MCPPPPPFVFGAQKKPGLDRVKAECLSVDRILDTLLKYMVLGSFSDELKEQFLEKTLSCKEFQDIGSSFQEAHGKIQPSERQLCGSVFSGARESSTSTMNAWKVSAEDIVAKLEKMSASDRRSFALENCL